MIRLTALNSSAKMNTASRCWSQTCFVTVCRYNFFLFRLSEGGDWKCETEK